MTTRSHHRLPHLIALAALLVGALVCPAPAQPMGVVFADRPLELDAVGLTMQVPDNTLVQAGVSTSAIAATIRPDPAQAGAGTPRWVISIQTPVASSSLVTVAAFTDEIVAELRRRFGTIKAVRDPTTGTVDEQIVDSRARVIARTPALRIAGLDAERVYIATPALTGSADDQEIHGYTIVKSTPTQFVVFELICPASSQRVATLIYETIVATARFASSRDLEASRGKAINKGLAALDQLTEAHYARALTLNTDRWERLYIPSPTGSQADRQDLGYRHIRAWKGQRGQLNPAKPKADYDRVEATEGYLMSMQVRLIAPSPRGFDISDTQAIFFMTPDASEEAWTVQMTRRPAAGGPPQSFLEVGARSGQSMRVVVEGPGIGAKTIRPILRGAGYICQVQAYLMPALLAQLGITDEFAFYAYRSADQAVSLRRLTLEHPGGNSALWRIKTTFGEGELPQITTLALSGETLRTELPGGRTWAPTTLDELVRLWRAQGLPMD